MSPIVGMFGHRQVGKTTLMNTRAQNYFTLDIRSQRERVEADPEAFLLALTGLATGIDEAQLVPDLFPALKERVRKDKRPGQFLLSGSVRFSSRKAIRESLTGRIVHLELLPMCQTELDARKPNELVTTLFRPSVGALEHRLSRAGAQDPERQVPRSLLRGGLPGACFIRGEQLLHARFDSQLETILERDLRLVYETRLPYQTLRSVLTNLALEQGTPLELAALARRSRVAVPTLRELIRAFESIFLIRVLETRGGERRPVVFFEDQGEASHLMGRSTDPLTDLARYVFSQIRVPLQLEPSLQPSYFQYRTRGGAYVPLCVERTGFSVGFLPTIEENPNRNEMASAVSFLRYVKKGRVLFVHRHRRAKVFDPLMASAPVTALA